MISPIIGFHHIAIIASNYEHSKYFYTEILGAKILAEMYRTSLKSYKLLPDGSQIELFSFPNPSKRPTVPEACGLRYLAFKIKFVESAIAFLQRFNIDAAPLRIDQLTGKKFTFFQDHDRLPLGFYH